jgi:Cof subfamily protein (haloacid dehalogenase superfamily)
MAQRRKVSLVLADVDGTLVNENKVLTKRAQASVRSLRDAGIRFAIVSGRPPLGTAMLFDALHIDTPIAGFNGGLFVDKDLSIVEQRIIPSDLARKAIELIGAHDLDVWVYRGNDWLITKPDAPHVARETWTVQYRPKVVANFDDDVDRAVKIVGVSDDHDRVLSCETDIHAAFGRSATVVRSQPYYIDVTHKDANKGAVVDYLSQILNVATSEIAAIGDQRNDLLMFKRSGFSIAMGNASEQVKSQADATTDSCNDEGFAKAMERLILGSPD